MDKRMIRDIIKLGFSICCMIIYTPCVNLFNMQGDKIRSDVNAMSERIHIKLNSFWGFIFFIHTNSYFRSLFYHRIGPVKAFLISWYRPGDKYFLISKTTKIGYTVLLAHPYGTILNAESIGDNFNFRHLTTLGDKNGKRPVIGNNVSLGASVTIIGGVKIGDNVIIGAGSVVVKDIPNNCVVAGNPGKIIKYN